MHGSKGLQGPAMIAFARKKFYPSLIISEEKIQVIRLDETGKRINRLAEERLDPQIIESGEVKDPQKLAKSLRTLFAAAKITENLVVVGIPENKCYTKVLELPKLKFNELEEAVTWEADTYLPVESEKVYMDWKIVREDQKNTVSILLIAVPKEIIEGYNSALKMAGLTPVAFETTALSLVRLIENSQERTLMVEILERHAVLMLSKGKAIESSSIVAFSEGSEQENFKNLIQTIVKMLTYYEEKKNQEKIQRIYICGEGASDSVRQTIAAGTGRSVEFAPVPVENLPKGKEQSLTVVSSLAKTEIQAPRDQYTINLLPPAIQGEFDHVNTESGMKFLLIVSTAVTISLTFSALIALLVLNNQNASLASQKKQLGPLSAQTGQVVAETQRLNWASSTIVSVSEKQTFPQGKIAQILSNTPEGVNIVLITLDENQHKLQITGRAATRQDMLKFRDNINSGGSFTDAILPLSSLERSQNVEFILTATSL